MSERRGHSYEFGRFTMDAANRLLLREGEPVHLHPKAFDTLLLLVERRGEVLTKEELIGRLWPDSFVEESNLSQNVYVLRKALGRDEDGSEYIKTVPKRGYQFVADVRERGEPPGEEDSGPRAAPPEAETRSAAGDALTARTAGDTTRAAEALAPGRAGKLTTSLLIAASLAAGLSVEAYLWLTGRARRAETAEAVRSIAVLPFKPLAAGGRDESLELGMADTLITRLGALRQVVVRPISAVRGYKELGQDPAAAGKELRVDAVLEGSLQHDGERIRVTARLVRVEDGGALWAGRFDERFTDIFSVQDAISERVAQSLSLRLSGEEERRLAKRDTGNAEAYLLYLKGRYFWDKRTEEATRKSIGYFEQVVAIDPDYALAYSGLADAYRSLSYFDPEGGVNLFPQSKAAALKALALDDTLAEAHTSLGAAKELYEWDFPGAEREYRRAIELNPDNAVAHHRYAVFLTRTGRIEEAQAEFGRALELDPLSLPINTDAATPFVGAREYERAAEQLRKAIELDPNFPRAHLLLSGLYTCMGRYGEAAAEARQAAALYAPPRQAGGPPRVNYQLAYVYAAAGRAREARQVLGELETSPDRRDTQPSQRYRQALAYAALGEKERTFALLEKLYEVRSPELLALRNDPAWEGLRGDPRFQDFLRRVGLGP